MPQPWGSRARGAGRPLSISDSSMANFSCNNSAKPTGTGGSRHARWRVGRDCRGFRPGRRHGMVGVPARSIAQLRRSRPCSANFTADRRRRAHRRRRPKPRRRQSRERRIPARQSGSVRQSGGRRRSATAGRSIRETRVGPLRPRRPRRPSGAARHRPRRGGPAAPLVAAPSHGRASRRRAPPRKPG